MFKSSLATHSSIDYDLFPLLTVRSCVSEANESKNGPRFCAEDKMTGGAYEIRNRKLVLEAEGGVAEDTGGSRTARQLSPNDLCTIKRQQERINALLTASAHCAVPPCVALPIDVYIQEQPSTGDTYVASVDAFSGLSLGDIIRSGWGVMEESVFLEILNAVEAFGYASASLPPHGNLSSDAIKQLLIVRDGAWEARQPSRWVVSDWLLLSDDSVTSFDPQAFLGDLEWMLHSSFAQLHISMTAEQGSSLMPPYRVEQLVSETVDRIRAHLLGEEAGTQDSPFAAGFTPQPESRSQTHVNIFPRSVEAALSVVAEADLAKAKLPAYRTEDASLASTSPLHDISSQRASTSTGGMVEFQVSGRAPPSPPHRHDLCGLAAGDRGTSGITANNGASSAALTIPLTASLEESQKSTGPGTADGRDTGSEGPCAARDMSLKDKVAYHQAALRHEQLLVNKHRRKNAPLPPRPQPVHPRGVSSRPSVLQRPSDEDDYYYYDPPSLTSPIKVKPSAYLMQGLQPIGSGRSDSSTGKPNSSPSRSAGTISGEAYQPDEGSRSSTIARRPPLSLVSPRRCVSRDQLRERLLDGVVDFGVLNQRWRAQKHRLQREAECRQREQRQQALSFPSPSGDVLSQPPAIRAQSAKPRASNLHHLSPNSLSARAKYARALDTQKLCTIGSSAALSNSAENRSPCASAAPSGRCSVTPSAPQVEAMPRFGSVSESPEPRPPSPIFSRSVSFTAGRKAPCRRAAACTRFAPLRIVGCDATANAAQSRAGKTPGKRPAFLRIPSRGTHIDTSAIAVQSAAAKTTVGAHPKAGAEDAATAAVVGTACFSRRQSAASVEPRPVYGTSANGKGAVGVGRQQQRSARADAGAPLVQRKNGTTAVQERITSPRAPPAMRAVSGFSLASEQNTGQTTSVPMALKKTPGVLQRFPHHSSEQFTNGMRAGVQRWPNSARTVSAQENPLFSQQTYQRVLSTGALRPQLHSVVITHRGRQAAGIPASAAPPSSLLGKPSCSARKRTGQPEVSRTTPLNPTQRELRVATAVEGERALSFANRGLVKSRVPQRTPPAQAAGLSRNADTQITHELLTAANDRCLVSRCQEPPLAATSRADLFASTRRAKLIHPPSQNRVTEATTQTSRRRIVPVSSASPGASLAAATQGAIQRDRRARAATNVKRTEPLT
ncbi:hypothetical protein JKF63_03026 [Porcisia hertigi]|uniref:Uncharacterized protein n=1 Tax=Porcisia hertigi TaxID=2761500 RepID=A0A836IE66_9TRYP|nr:hypothetical protein JKF63_03026 [Porcisia hertigi]